MLELVHFDWPALAAQAAAAAAAGEEENNLASALPGAHAQLGGARARLRETKDAAACAPMWPACLEQNYESAPNGRQTSPPDIDQFKPGARWPARTPNVH